MYSSDDPDAFGDAIGEIASGDDDLLKNLLKENFKRALAESISELPERERLVMSMYHEQEAKLREIGSVLGISESRVCQIHGQALIRLRARMVGWVGDGE
jgi:RNA polymerase sigma factor for flagellar operon FliA